MPTTRWHDRLTACSIFLICFITFSVKQIKKIEQAAGSTGIGFSAAAAFSFSTP